MKVQRTALLLVCLAFPMSAQEVPASQLLGDWLIEITAPGRVTRHVLFVGPDNVTWTSNGDEQALEEISVADEILTFQRTVQRGGQDFSSLHTASIVDGILQGSMSTPRGPRTFTGRRLLPEEVEARASRNEQIEATKPCDVLAVFAHPDDETFASGTLAKLAKNGTCVLLIYATSGGAGGDLTGRGLTGASLAREREGEMRHATAALGIPLAPLFLRYPDGKVQEHWSEILSDMETLVERVAPQVMITFGPDGYYGHQDHIAIGQIAGRAFDRSGGPSHLLHVAISESKNDFIVKAGGGNRFRPVADRLITYRVNPKGLLPQRMDAMAAHKTQFDKRQVDQFLLLANMRPHEEFVEARRAVDTEASAILELLEN